MMKIMKYMYKYIVGIFFIPIPATPPLLRRNLQIICLSASYILLKIIIIISASSLS